MKHLVTIGGLAGLGLAILVNNWLGVTGDQAGTAAVASILAGAIAAKALQRGMLGASSGFWHSVPGRWLIGRMAALAVIALLAVPVSLAVWEVFYRVIVLLAVLNLPRLIMVVAGFYGLFWWAIVGSIVWRLRIPAKIFIGKSTRPFRRWYRSFRMGRGGSAGFASILEEWANRWQPGMIFLGHSMHDRHWPVGVKDDRMMITIAGNGGGKLDTAIAANSLTYPGSMFVNDPKGQDAAVTASARRALGQKAYVLAPLAKDTAHLNPLADLDPEAADYVERVKGIVDALVIAGEGKDRVWSEWARIVIEGLVDLEIRYQDKEPDHAE